MKKLLYLISILVFITATSCKKDNEPLSIGVSPTQPTAHSAVQFTSSQQGSGWFYDWTFGDGDFVTTSSTSTSHSYDQPGTYNVTLTIESDNGSPQGNCSISITVQ